MSHYYKLAANQLNDLKAKKDYALGVLAAGGLDKGSAKEWGDLVDGYSLEIFEQEQVIAFNISEGNYE